MSVGLITVEDMNTRTRDLVLLDQDLSALARAEDLLSQAEQVRTSDPRACYELIHRAALRSAGVLVTRANRARRRKLPLNVWTALDRIGGPGRAWAQDAAQFVVERDRLDRDPAAIPDPELLEHHHATTRARITSVKEELLSDLASPQAVALAG